MKDSLNDILVSDLPKFAYTQGYTEIDKNKSSSNWLVLKNPGTNDKIMINQKGREGIMFFRNTDPGLGQDKGNIVNFCINRLGGFPSPTPRPSKPQYKEAFGILKSFIGAPEIENITYTKTAKTGTSPSVKLKELRERTDLTSDYLLKHRGIDPKILNHPLWAGTVAESKAVLPNKMVIYNTAFLKKDVEGNTVGYVTHYYSAKKAAHQKIVNEKKEGLFYSNFMGRPYDIYIGETAIDCLSHYQVVNPEKPVYISIEGQISQNKIKLVNELLDAKGKPNNILSVTDNDYSGYVFDLQMAIGIHNHKNPDSPIETIQNENFTRYVLHGRPNISYPIKSETIDIFNKEAMLFGGQHLKPYLNIGFTKNFSFVELPRDKKRKLFRFLKPLTTAIYSQNDIIYCKDIPPNIGKRLEPTKDWNEYIQEKKNERNNVTKKGLKI